MDNNERIETGDYLFGVGLVITDIFDEQLFNEQDNVTILPLKEDEEIEYDGKLEEIRVICQNEEFTMALSKYYIPFKDRLDETYWELDHDEIILVKELDITDDFSKNEEDITNSFLKLGETFKHLQKYLQSSIDRLFFFFYFPENIIIDNDGEPLVSFKHENEWEHRENF